MLKYILSSFFLMCSFVFSCKAASADSTSLPFFRGALLDVDIAEPVISCFSDSHQGANVSLSLDFKHRFFAVLLAGYAKYDATDDYSSYAPVSSDYQYKVDGPYFKVGVDFNILRTRIESDKKSPFGFLGMRYAFSPFNYDIKSSSIFDSDRNYSSSYSISGSSFAHWFEFVGGFRVPIYNRIYLGMDGNYKFSFHASSDKEGQGSDGNKKIINQTYAPGFGNSNHSGFGLRYLIGFYF